MKRFLAILLAVFFLVSPVNNQAAAANEAPPIISESAVLMDAETGQVLFEKSMHMKLYPASITKVMTVLLGIEKGQLQDYITMSREAVYSIKRGSSHIALDEGEQITLEQALMAAMLPSANDASNGIAEHVSGSIADFARLMNQRAREAGALNSSFVNPHGLPDEKHVSTAYDMAMITQEALKNEKFREILGTVRYTIPPTNKNDEVRDLWSEHRMLTTNQYHYDGVIGGKTGYTRESQNTLVTVARRGNRELIAVVMKSENYGVYKDTIALFDYGFNEFVETRIVPAVPADPSGINQEAAIIQDVLNQHQETSIKRLLHKGISPANIVFDFQQVEVDPQKQPDLILKMYINDTGSLMYGDLGSVYLNNASPRSVKPDWTSTALQILKIIAAIVLSIIALLLLIRWFFKLRKAVRRKKLSSVGKNQLGRYYKNDR